MDEADMLGQTQFPHQGVQALALLTLVRIIRVHPATHDQHLRIGVPPPHVMCTSQECIDALERLQPADKQQDRPSRQPEHVTGLLAVARMENRCVHPARNDLDALWVDPVVLHHMVLAGLTLGNQVVAMFQNLVFHL